MSGDLPRRRFAASGQAFYDSRLPSSRRTVRLDHPENYPFRIPGSLQVSGRRRPCEPPGGLVTHKKTTSSHLHGCYGESPARGAIREPPREKMFILGLALSLHAGLVCAAR
jgi:hypothetical protein